MRECGIYPAGLDTGRRLGLWCWTNFPSGTPPVTTGPFRGPTNTVRITPPKGPGVSVEEGSPITGLFVAPTTWTTVGVFACTALPGYSVECNAPTGGFRIADAMLAAETS